MLTSCCGATRSASDSRALISMRIAGRRIQIAGSCHPDTDPQLSRYAHLIVDFIASNSIRRGATVLCGVGAEPPLTSDAAQSVVFDWTVIDAVARCLRSGECVARPNEQGIIAAVVSSRTAGKIPAHRRAVWDELVRARAVDLRYLEPGWSAGGLQRERESELGDILIALGGSQGVEHLAQLYAQQGKPVIPLDVPIRGSTPPESLGARRLYEMARSRPDEFIRTARVGAAATLLTSISSNGAQRASEAVAADVLAVLDELDAPWVFYIRLLDKGDARFASVERYFRNVIDVVAGERGYRGIEMGRDRVDLPWINDAIFKSIQKSTAVVVDLTGVRPNCMMELGFSFGRRKPVILCASRGTRLPFDVAPLECMFWSDDDDGGARQELRSYWTRVATRSPL